MQKTIVITDLTQMPNPNGVCVVGIDQHNRCIRPVLPPPGVLKEHLYIKGKLTIQPRAKVGFNFHKVPVEPPHIEDLGFNLNSIVYEGLCTDAEWEKVLHDSSFSTVDDIYDGLLQEHRWVEPGANVRSVGTLSQVDVIAVQLPEWSGKLKYRLSFRDNTRLLYDIPISDLAFRELSYTEVRRLNRSPVTVSQHLTRLIISSDHIYLRIGLARKFPTSDGNFRCWTQITGIYTFPDYLEGKSFAHFEAMTPSSRAKAYDVKELNEKNPKAYAKWTENEDNSLRNEYLRGKTVEELSHDFQRKPGAIRSRLIRLGLLN